MTTTHNDVRRNAQNVVVFPCNVCNKDYGSPKSLASHRRNAKHTHPIHESTEEPAVMDTITSEETKHTRKVPESTEELTAMDTITIGDEFDVNEQLYSTDGRIRNEISHQTERVIELSTSLAMGNVQDAVKRAFYSVREEMIPLYAGACVDRADSWERVSKILAPFEDGLIMTVLRDTFDLAKNLKTDLECLEQAPPIAWSVTRWTE